MSSSRSREPDATGQDPRKDTVAGPMDRLAALGVFLKAAETGSFSAASRILGVSASAIGKTVARLESRLGVRLFHRNTRSMTLTSEGQMLLARCLRIRDEVDAAEAELAEAQSAPQGLLRVSMPLVSRLMMPVLQKFMEKYPHIQLELDFSDRMVDIIEEGHDVVLRTGEGDDSRLVSRTMGRYTHVCVASPAYLSRRGTPFAPADLKDHACLHHRFPATGKLRPWPRDRDDTIMGIDLPVTVTMNTIEPLVDLACRGMGIANVPEFSVRDALADGSLVAVLPAFTGKPVAFRAVWASGRQMPPRVRAFVDFMAHELFPGG